MDPAKAVVAAGMAMHDRSGATVSIHGHEIGFVRAGEGPALVLLHGLLGSRRSWRELVATLARSHTVVAPDLLGHGESAKPVGDYSLGAHAALLRDLLDALDVPRATLVGHSLGGGIAMQFAYLFPERCERLVLVSSGGLGRDLHPVLRAPTLPGAGWVLPLLSSARVLDCGNALASRLRRLGVRPGAELAEALRGYATLEDADARRAFLATLRTVVSPAGQTVDASDRLYLLDGLPTLLVWGGRDRIIPLRHGVTAHQRIRDSRLVVFSAAGHFPHLSDPERFSAVVEEFVRTSRPR